jgi:hypothetical protein
MGDEKVKMFTVTIGSHAHEWAANRAAADLAAQVNQWLGSAGSDSELPPGSSYHIVDRDLTAAWFPTMTRTHSTPHGQASSHDQYTLTMAIFYRVEVRQ